MAFSLWQDISRNIMSLKWVEVFVTLRESGTALRRAGGAFLVLALAGCASGNGPVDSIRVPAPPAITQEPAPPPSDAEFASAQMIWALRGGLNVAALQCKDTELQRNYNALLGAHRVLLNDAYQTEQARYRDLHGTRWQASHDVAMTRMYNGFANMPDRGRYCGTAAGIAADAAAMPSQRLAVVAGRMLRALDPEARSMLDSAR